MQPELSSTETAAAAFEEAAQRLRSADVEAVAVAALDVNRGLLALAVQRTSDCIANFSAALFETLSVEERATVLRLYADTHRAAVESGKSVEEAGRLACRAAADAGFFSVPPAEFGAAM